MTTETFDGSLRAYTDANIKNVQSSMPEAKRIGDNQLIPDNKAPSYKRKYTNKMNDLELAQTTYSFEGTQGRKLIVTWSSPASQGSKLDSLFDECMKTFAVTGK